jgi:hypothetical protein
MPTTITWNDGVLPPSEFTIPDETMASLISQSQTITTVENGQIVPVYTGVGTEPVQAWLIAVFAKQIVLPSQANFPPPSLEAALAGLVAAQQVVLVAQAATIPGFVPVSQQ